MTGKIKILAVSALSLALASCMTTPNISYDSDPAQNFSTYSSFAWASGKPMIAVGDRDISPIVQKEIADAIKTTLTSRGYSYVTDVNAADFAITYTVGARDKLKVSEVPDYFFQDRMNWRWGGQYFRPLMISPPTQTVVRGYTEGTLSIDIYDVKRRSPVWHGKGQKNLSKKELRGENTDIQGDVAQILLGFPPQP